MGGCGPICRRTLRVGGGRGVLGRTMPGCLPARRLQGLASRRMLTSELWSRCDMILFHCLPGKFGYCLIAAEVFDPHQHQSRHRDEDLGDVLI